MLNKAFISHPRKSIPALPLLSAGKAMKLQCVAWAALASVCLFQTGLALPSVGWNQINFKTYSGSDWTNPP